MKMPESGLMKVYYEMTTFRSLLMEAKITKEGFYVMSK